MSSDQRFMRLSQLSGHHDGQISHGLHDFLEGSTDAVWGLEKDSGRIRRCELLEPVLTVFRPSRGKAEEHERMSLETGCRESCGNRTWPWNGLKADARLDSDSNQLLARIGDQGSAGIRDERDILARLQARNQRRRFSPFIVLMQARRRRCDAITRE